MRAEAKIVNLFQVKEEKSGGFVRRVLISSATTETPCLRLVWGQGEVGAHRETHTHPADETIFILQGSATLTVEGKQHRVGAYDAVVIPAGAEHSFLVTSNEPLTLINAFCDECEMRH